MFIQTCSSLNILTSLKTHCSFCGAFFLFSLYRSVLIVLPPYLYCNTQLPNCGSQMNKNTLYSLLHRVMNFATKLFSKALTPNWRRSEQEKVSVSLMQICMKLNLNTFTYEKLTLFLHPCHNLIARVDSDI